MPKWCAISWTTVIRISSSSTSEVVAELLLERDPVDGDLVREDAGVALDAALGERDAEVEAEEVRVLAFSSSTTISTLDMACRSSAGSDSSAARTCSSKSTSR